jgi:predicted Zn-dependent protease
VPDGGIYVNVGLLARFENEAQLATVLAHEGTHFTHRTGS